jgi:hypothetical protein
MEKRSARLGVKPAKTLDEVKIDLSALFAPRVIVINSGIEPTAQEKAEWVGKDLPAAGAVTGLDLAEE